MSDCVFDFLGKDAYFNYHNHNNVLFYVLFLSVAA